MREMIRANLSHYFQTQRISLDVDTSQKPEEQAPGFRFSIQRCSWTIRLVYSHSIVAGGLEEISYTTRLTPFTLLMISLDIFPKNSYGK